MSTQDAPQATFRADVGEGRPELDQRLSDELDRFNAAATPGVTTQRELTVRLLDEDGELAAGLSGWTWGVAAGIGMTWVREDERGAGLGSRLLEEFEEEARARGCSHVFVTSFTFQAPGFYERHGYVEYGREVDYPPGHVNHLMRKQL